MTLHRGTDSTEKDLFERGCIKAFREYLNKKHAETGNHKHHRFQQRTRAYGDYLYHQDREKFRVELLSALLGDQQFSDFEWPKK